MSSEELKIVCLELSIKHISDGEGSVLSIAKEFYDWISETNYSTVLKQQLEE